MEMIRYFDPKVLTKKVTMRIDPPIGWYPIGFGGVKATHFSGQAHADSAKKAHQTTTPCINESAFELCAELSVLEQLQDPGMYFIELGAGWGAQTVNIVTAVRNHVVDTGVCATYSIALEADPGHYGFLCETFRENQIVGLPLYGAISRSLGWPPFSAMTAPADSYGQKLEANGNLHVPCFTLANLLETFDIPEVHLVHMDIQGAEPDALLGADDLITRFRYIIVCPHRTGHMGLIRGLLADTHNEIVAYDQRSGYHNYPGFPLPVYLPQDGIMLWERKDN
jgi:FkbM family methyltransferase